VTDPEANAGKNKCTFMSLEQNAGQNQITNIGKKMYLKVSQFWKQP